VPSSIFNDFRLAFALQYNIASNRKDSGFKKKSMTLKIQKSARWEVVVFTLIGRINADEVAELKRLFDVEGQDHRIVLDLKEVKLLNRDAVRFLARCEANGTKLENCPAYVREWIVREGYRR
jgi:hypothetical protein